MDNTISDVFSKKKHQFSRKKNSENLFNIPIHALPREIMRMLSVGAIEKNSCVWKVKIPHKIEIRTFY